MAEVTWADLAKSVDDNTKISDEIDSKILAHNEDPSAHGQLGEGIYNHRVGTILDHADGSITSAKIGDFQVLIPKIAYDKVYINCAFESLDGWSITGDGIVDLYFGSIYIQSTAGLNHEILATTPADVMGLDFGANNPVYEAVLKIDQTTDQLVYFGIGDPTTEFLGFKVVDNTLYACWSWAETEHTQEISGIDITKFHTYRVIAESGGDITFYIDGSLEYTTANIFEPGGEYLTLFYYYMKSTSDGGVEMVVVNSRFYEDR